MKFLRFFAFEILLAIQICSCGQRENPQGGQKEDPLPGAKIESESDGDSTLVHSPESESLVAPPGEKSLRNLPANADQTPELRNQARIDAIREMQRKLKVGPIQSNKPKRK